MTKEEIQAKMDELRMRLINETQEKALEIARRELPGCSASISNGKIKITFSGVVMEVTTLKLEGGKKLLLEDA